jgi:hypothetical protein
VEGKEGWEALVRCQIKRNESGRRREAGASPRSKRRGEMGGGGFSSAWSHGKKKRGGGGPIGAMRRGGVGVRRQHGAHAGEAGGGWHGTVA